LIRERKRLPQINANTRKWIQEASMIPNRLRPIRVHLRQKITFDGCYRYLCTDVLVPRFTLFVGSRMIAWNFFEKARAAELAIKALVVVAPCPTQR